VPAAKLRFDVVAAAVGRLWYSQVLHAIGYAGFYSRSHNAVIHFYARIPDLQKEYTATGGKWANVRMELEQFLI
jgi:hypothetical protein